MNNINGSPYMRPSHHETGQYKQSIFLIDYFKIESDRFKVISDCSKTTKTIKSEYFKIINDYFNVISNHFNTKCIYWANPIVMVSP